VGNIIIFGARLPRHLRVHCALLAAGACLVLYSRFDAISQRNPRGAGAGNAGKIKVLSQRWEQAAPSIPHRRAPEALSDHSFLLVKNTIIIS